MRGEKRREKEREIRIYIPIFFGCFIQVNIRVFFV